MGMVRVEVVRHGEIWHLGRVNRIGCQQGKGSKEPGVTQGDVGHSRRPAWGEIKRLI